MYAAANRAVKAARANASGGNSGTAPPAVELCKEDPVVDGAAEEEDEAGCEEDDAGWEEVADCEVEETAVTALVVSVDVVPAEVDVLLVSEAEEVEPDGELDTVVADVVSDVETAVVVEVVVDTTRVEVHPVERTEME